MYKNFARFFRLEYWFVILSLIFGTIFALMVPPNQVPDEDSHTFRVYAIWNGDFTSPNVKAPADINALLTKYRFLPSGNGKFDFKTYLNDFSKTGSLAQVVVMATVYNPILYTPQILGVGIGKLFRLNPLMVFALGRLFSVFFYTFIGFIILKKALVARRSLFVLLAMPMTIYLAASYSADAMQNILAFAYLSLLVNKVYIQTTISRKDWGVFIFLSILLALAKPSSIVFLLISLIVPASQLGGLRKKVLFFSSQFGLGILCYGLWTMLIPAGRIHPEVEGFVAPLQQTFYILLNPLTFIQNVLFTLGQYWNFYFHSFVGQFGWLTILMPDFVYALFLAAFLLALWLDTCEKLALDKSQKWLFVGVFSLYILILFAGLYVAWTPLANGIVMGLQGRYFIPIFPIALYLLLASLGKRAQFSWDWIPTSLIALLSTIVLLFAVQTIFLKLFTPCGEKFYSVADERCEYPAEIQAEEKRSTVGRINKSFTQTFTMDCDKISTLSFLLLPAAGKNDGSIDIILQDKATDTTILQTRTLVKKLIKEKWMQFSFSPVQNVRNHPFSLTITPVDGPISAATLAVTTNDIYPGGELLDIKPATDLVFKYSCPGGFFYEMRHLIGR